MQHVAHVAESDRLRVDAVVLKLSDVLILRGVSLAVEPARTLGLLGANGSGKSSLLNVVSGYYRPSAGSVRLDGIDMAGRSPARVAASGVGRSFQSIGRMEDLTVLENVLLGLEPVWRARGLAAVLGLPSSRRAEAEARQRASQIIAEFDLAAYRDRLLSACPYGVRKVADLLRAMVSSPRLLLLDEPTSGVSTDDRRHILELIRAWTARTNCSTVVVDHDIEFVSALADSVVALVGGSVVASGAVAEVLGNEQVLATFVGSAK
ncbi:ABC transporter ATP-binding protein [Streptomyces abyssomicinicus]|uniref:ABC transporter ATP-binding protein n=1 Tax=Streptomyces abyssomicinicus TaxID=574929 RepID=UPI0012506807|nr:ATP-binding cassette domain-containing protein [Streptomyces abyssomicinicus]